MILRELKWKFADPLLLRVARRISWLTSQEQAIVKADYMADLKTQNILLGKGVVLHDGYSFDQKAGKAGFINIGDNTHIRGNLLTFWNAGQITLGKHCYVGHGSHIWSQSSIVVGNHVLISHGVDIHDTDAHPLDPFERRKDVAGILDLGHYVVPTKTISRPIVIEDDAWICFKASILKGVRIGKGSIVAAASVVTKDVPPGVVVGGNPAVILREIPEGER